MFYKIVQFKWAVKKYLNNYADGNYIGLLNVDFMIKPACWLSCVFNK